MTFVIIMRKRDKKVHIYSEIIKALKTPKNTLQIAKTTNNNWITIKNALEVLEKISVVRKCNNNYILSNPPEYNENALLGLPLRKSQEKTTSSVANRIKQIWKITNKQEIKKTFLQKILTKIIQNNNLGIPYGWYLFGLCTIQQSFDNKIPATKKYDKQIREIVKEFSTLSSSTELIKHHYLQEANELYLTKHKISEILSIPFTQDSINILKINCNNLLFNFKKTEDNEDLLEHIYGFVSILVRLIKSFSIHDLEDIRTEINEAFISVWELIGTSELFETLNMKKELSRPYFIERIKTLKHIADTYLFKLMDNLPELPIINDELSKFKGILVK